MAIIMHNIFEQKYFQQILEIKFFNFKFIIEINVILSA